MSMQVVLASQNKKKLGEMQQILSAAGVQVLLQSQLGFQLEVEETGTSFAENARLKAEAVCHASGIAAIADDSGLVVDALDGAPGIYSARYGGEGLDDADRYHLLLKNMQGKENRACRFVCAICCVFPDGSSIEASGTCEGELASAPRGEGGFGYDPIFKLPAQDKRMAELSADEKNEISHRGAALRIFKTEWEKHIHGTH